MRKLYFILLAILASSCTTPGKVEKWLLTKPKAKTEPIVTGYLDWNKLFAATYNARNFPIQEKVITKRDTVKTLVTVPGDSIPCPPVKDTKTGKVYTPKVKCPDVSYFQEQITELTEKTQESSAKADMWRLRSDSTNALNSELQSQLEQETSEKQDYRTQRNWLAGILAGLIVLVILAGLRRMGVIK